MISLSNLVLYLYNIHMLFICCKSVFVLKNHMVIFDNGNFLGMQRAFTLSYLLLVRYCVTVTKISLCINVLQLLSFS